MHRGIFDAKLLDFHTSADTVISGLKIRQFPEFSHDALERLSQCTCATTTAHCSFVEFYS